MPYSYAIEGRIVHISWLGIVSSHELQALDREMPRIAGELGFAPDVLHTFDGVQGYSFQPIAVYMLSLLRKRVRIPTPVRSALVAQTGQTHSVAKVFKALNRTRNLEMELFAGEEAARRWLARE